METHSRLTNFTLGLLATFLIAYVLVVAKSFFLPVVIAIVIGYLIISIINGIEKFSYKGLRIPRFLASGITFLFLGFLITMVFSLISGNFSSLLQVAPIYQEKLTHLMDRLFHWLEIPVPEFTDSFKQFDFVTILSTIIVTLTEVAGMFGLIAIYVLFILIEYQHFEEKLSAMLPKETTLASTRNIIKKVSNQIQTYVRLKTLISLVTAFSSYAVLLLVGVDFPEFWSFLIFLLNYIPNIGAIIGTIFPCALTLVQFESILPFVEVTLSLTAIQFTLGNIIEPRLMGKRFNLSSLVIILSLTIWGQIWGVVGMFLCVPLVMIMSIIFANFSSTKPIAVMLSRDGKLD